MEFKLKQKIQIDIHYENLISKNFWSSTNSKNSYKQTLLTVLDLYCKSWLTSQFLLLKEKKSEYLTLKTLFKYIYAFINAILLAFLLPLTFWVFFIFLKIISMLTYRYFLKIFILNSGPVQELLYAFATKISLSFINSPASKIQSQNRSPSILRSDAMAPL